MSFGLLMWTMENGRRGGLTRHQEAAALVLHREFHFCQVFSSVFRLLILLNASLHGVLSVK